MPILTGMNDYAINMIPDSRKEAEYAIKNLLRTSQEMRMNQETWKNIMSSPTPSNLGVSVSVNDLFDMSRGNIPLSPFRSTSVPEIHTPSRIKNSTSIPKKIKKPFKFNKEEINSCLTDSISFYKQQTSGK